MRKIELQLSQMKCPNYCCKCGSTQTNINSYSERIALIGQPFVTVSVQVPVCKPCANRKLYFYAAAITVLCISIFGFKLATSGYPFGRYISALFLVAAGLYIAAIKSTPIKILDYRPRTGTISLGCLHNGFASELAELSRGTDTKYVRVRKRFWLAVLIVLIAVVAALSLGF